MRLLALDSPISLASLSPELEAPPTAPDPTVAAYLNNLTPAAITTWDRRLSGEDSVVIGGVSRRLRSRYSWSTNGRLSEQYVYEQLRAMGYQPSYVAYTTPHGNLGWRNIVVDIPGRVDASRLVLLVGHLDSISYDGNQAATLAPGADDNGSGSAALLAMASLLKDQPFAYTVRLVWFTGEEFGYWGSKPYVQSLAAQGANVLAAINLDMIGYDGDSDRVVELHTGTVANNIRLGDYLAAANQVYGLNLTLERKTTTASRFSDHRSFWDQGYTSLLVIENFFDDMAEFGRLNDRNPSYHQTSDRVNLVSFDYTTAIARMALAAALHLALPQGQTPTPTPTPISTGCYELVSNGGFETSGNWTFGSTARPAGISSASAHSGSRSLRTGIVPPTANARAHSSAYQRLALPAGVSSITLEAWNSAGGADANDYSEIMLLKSDFTALRLLWRGRPSDAAWQHRTFDLSAYGGQTVYIYFNTYNDGANARAWAYFDDISIRACAAPGSPTPTPYPQSHPDALPYQHAHASGDMRRNCQQWRLRKQRRLDVCKHSQSRWLHNRRSAHGPSFHTSWPDSEPPGSGWREPRKQLAGRTRPGRGHLLHRLPDDSRPSRRYRHPHVLA